MYVTAEEKKRIDPTKCYICQGSPGRHGMKVKMDRRVRRICNRVDNEHAEWLLDHKMDVNYLRITRKRRSGIMGIIVLMLAFVALIWAFTYFQDFKPVFMAVAGVISLLIGVFVVAEFRTITVSDRMRALLSQVEMERPIVSPLRQPSLERLDDVAALAGEAEPEKDRVAIHAATGPAPTQAAAPMPLAAAEDGIPGVPQPVVVASEWEVMGVEDPTPGGPQPPPGTPAQPVPPPPTIEDLPDPGAPAPGTAPPPFPPPIAAPPLAASPPAAAPMAPSQPPPPLSQPPPPPPPAQAAPPMSPTPPLPRAPLQQAPPPPPVAAPPALVQELPAERAPPPPPSTALAPQAPTSPPQSPARAPPPAPQPPAQAPPPVPQPPAQVPPAAPQPPAQAPPAAPQPPAQAPPPPPQPPAPPVQYQPPAAPTPPPTPQRKPQAEADDVEEAEWVDWE